MMRDMVGIYGGSFNPPHLAHVALASEVQKRCAFKPLWVVPTKSPPHKPPYEITDEHRVAMARLAFESIADTKVSTFEIDNEGVSYAIRTIEHFARQHTGAELCFILGADAFYDLPHWHAFPDVLEACSYVVVNRAGWDVDGEDGEPTRLEQRFEKLMAAGLLKPTMASTNPFDEVYLTRTGGRIGVLNLRLPEISSTEVRLRLQLGERITNSVPDSVLGYLKSHGLYGTR